MSGEVVAYGRKWIVLRPLKNTPPIISPNPDKMINLMSGPIHADYTIGFNLSDHAHISVNKIASYNLENHRFRNKGKGIPITDLNMAQIRSQQLTLITNNLLSGNITRYGLQEVDGDMVIQLKSKLPPRFVVFANENPRTATASTVDKDYSVLILDTTKHKLAKNYSDQEVFLGTFPWSNGPGNSKAVQGILAQETDGNMRNIFEVNSHIEFDNRNGQGQIDEFFKHIFLGVNKAKATGQVDVVRFTADANTDFNFMKAKLDQMVQAGQIKQHNLTGDASSYPKTDNRGKQIDYIVEFIPKN